MSDATSLTRFWERVWALSRKESLQIVRDPSSILIAFVLPAALLFIFGYGINLDTTQTRIAIVRHDDGAAARGFAAALSNTTALDTRELPSDEVAQRMLAAGGIRGYVVIRNDFSEHVVRGAEAPVQVATDASEPNTASFVAANVQGVWEKWREQWLAEAGVAAPSPVHIEARAWFNPSAESRNFLIPGSIVIIMTILGALLTSLVIAREWERGTMEALLAARVTKGEILLSKLIPYYALAIIAMTTCMVVAVMIMGIPFRGSLLALWLITTLFLGSTLGLGLLISTVTRNQFNAAQTALNVAYMPAIMLSGFIYEISSMPKAIQLVSYAIPARYFMSSLQTLFQAGVIWETLLPDILFMGVTTLMFVALTLKKTGESLE
jgi:ABC-2 type transport system permease protein